MARDGWRVFLWDDDVVDPRVALKPVTIGLAAGGPSFREAVAALELPAKSAAAGILAAVLYGAPVLFIANIFLGLGARLMGAILAAAAFVGSLAAWRITTWERGNWQRERERLSDHADPPPWK
jgi:phage-related minor tail protein